MANTQTYNSFEVNFDGLVGPSHHYGALSFGNEASSKHGGKISYPKKAALQGLEKMRTLHGLGVKQAVLPPHDRPHIPTLKRLGFSGKTDTDIIQRAAKEAPGILSAVSSASAMWVANAATISPFADSTDGKTHITPANLSSMFHRSIEVETTAAVMRAIFQGESYCHHQALPSNILFSDEGAANHTRLCSSYGEPGVELFVYGASHSSANLGPAKYPSRQSLESCQAIARSHGLAPDKTVIIQQNPAAIDAGVFHNDVIAVGNGNTLFFHEQAFLDSTDVRRQLDAAFADKEIVYIEVPSNQVTLDEAVSSYLFNTQLVSLPNHRGQCIIAPEECREVKAVHEYLQHLEDKHEAIDEVRYLDLRQSMNNGGGPACLRLRVVMSEQQIANTQAKVMFTDELYSGLKAWIEKHYRDSLQAQDIVDPNLLLESRRALDELTSLLNLGSIYEFQQA